MPEPKTTFFTELTTLLKHSPLVTMSIAREGSKLRVVITPKHPEKLDESDELDKHEAALITPLAITGTAAELDEGLIAELKRYLGLREALVSEVATYEEELTAAKLEVRAKTGESRGKRGAGALPAPAAKPSLPAAAEPAVEPAPKPPLTGPAAALAGV